MVVRKSGDKYADIQLPKTKSTVETDMSAYTFFFYGREKIGKTTLCAQFKDSLLLFLEPGGKAISAYQERVYDWEHFKKLIELFKVDKFFKTVVIDTADYMHKYCSQYVCDNLGIPHESKADWGYGWTEVKKEMESVLVPLFNTGKGIVFTSHWKENTVKERRSKDTSTEWVPTLSNQAQEVIRPMVDVWCYLGYEGKERYMYFRGTDLINCGYRSNDGFPAFPDKVSMGNSPIEAYNNLVAGFEGTYVEPIKPTKEKENK